MINEQLAQKYVVGLSILVFLLLVLFVGLAREDKNRNLTLGQHIDFLEYALDQMEMYEKNPSIQLHSLHSIQTHYPAVVHVDAKHPLVERCQQICLNIFYQINTQDTPLTDKEQEILQHCAEVLYTLGLWNTLAELDITNYKRHTGNNGIHGSTVITVFIFIIIVAPLLWLSHYRMHIGRAPVDPKAETLVNVDPIDIDTQAVTIDDGQHTTTHGGQTTTTDSDHSGV